MPLHFDNSYARLPEHFYERIQPTPVAAPAWLAVSSPLGAELGLTEDELTSSELLSTLAGNRIPEGAEPIALAYAGHQFGGFVPRLGDGRAVLLGEVLGTDGVRHDVQLKGSGPTPFSRGGDGRSALGPALREFLVSEAMHVLGVPTTRALAVVLTGEPVYRDTVLPGAVLTRIASSHLRVGTFEYFAAQGDREGLATLVDHALARHYPEAADSELPALALFEAVMDAQIRLVAKWLAFGFVHGVMNTDNTAISGETLDYGPCAFLDSYHPQRVFSSIDRQGRYAFANQPRIAMWNLARLAEALLPLLDEGDTKTLALFQARLERFPSRMEAAHEAELRKKLGLGEAHEGDLELAEELLQLMATDRVDYTLAFRHLSTAAHATDDASAAATDAPSIGAATDAATTNAEAPFRELFTTRDRVDAWLSRWRERTACEATGPAAITPAERARRMQQVNPAFIPRNHRVEEAIAAAMRGDSGPFERLRHVLARPFDDQPEHAELAMPPGDEQWRYRTFCGT